MKALLRILGVILTFMPLLVVGTSFQYRMTFILLLEIVSFIGWELIVVKAFVEDDINFIRNLILFLCLWPLVIALTVVVNHSFFRW